MTDQRQTEFLTAALMVPCVCGAVAAISLLDAANKGCISCSIKYLAEAVLRVNGTTALIEAVKRGHVGIVRLLYPVQGGQPDALGKKAFCYAAERGEAAFDEMLEAVDQEFYEMILKMREMPCVCMGFQQCIIAVISRGCMRCCASYISQASYSMDSIIANTNAAESSSLTAIKFMHSLQASQRRLYNLTDDLTELDFAVMNNLYDVAVLLLDQQHEKIGWNRQKTSVYATAIYNPRLWALFPKDIGPEYAADLEAAHSSQCTCGGKSKYLHEIIDNGCLKCCVRLIPTHTPGIWGREIFIEATKKSNVNILRLLKYIWGGIQDKDEKSAMIIAAASGNHTAVEVLARREAKLQDKEGKTALMFAANNNHSRVVQLLIPFEAGMQDNYGRTALMYAVQNKHSGAAKQLIPLEKNIKDKEGRSPEDYAFRTDNLTTWRLFDPGISKEHGMQRQRQMQSACTCRWRSKNLIEAAKAGCVSCCKKFVDEAGKATGKKTALMEAAERGHVEIVELLSVREAGLRDSMENTALILAASVGHPEVVRILMPHEAGMVSKGQRVALSEAVLHFHGECIDVLRQSPEEIQASGVTQVMLAAYDGDLQTVLQNRDEWGSAFESGASILNLALIRGTPTFLRALTRAPESRQRLSSGTIKPKSYAINIVNLARFSDMKPWHLRQLLYIVCSAVQRNRSALVTKALFGIQRDEPTRLWHVFCSPHPEDLRGMFSGLCDEAKTLRGLRFLRNAGVCLDTAIATNVREVESQREVSAYLAQNPLKVKQLELAQKQSQTAVSDEKSFAWREMEAEASFNRAALLECRDLWWKTPQAPRTSPVPPPVGKCGPKLARNAVVIHGAYIYACTKLWEMIDE